MQVILIFIRPMQVQPQTSSNFKSPIQQICQIPCLVILQNCICNRSHFQCLPPTRCPSGRRRSAGPSRRGSGSTARTSTASRARKLAPGEFCNILDILYYESLLLNQLLNSPEKRSVGELVQFYYLWKKTERHDVFANRYMQYNLH